MLTGVQADPGLMTEPVPVADDQQERRRIDLRVDPELRHRIAEQAVRVFGTPNLSAYIRMAVLRQLAEDEAAHPAKSGKRRADN